MTSNPDTLPTSGDLSGKCPRCGRVSNFHLIRDEPLRFLNTGVTRRVGNGPSESVPGRIIELVSVVGCMGCGAKSVVIEVEMDSRHGLQGVLWWPTNHLADLDQYGASVPQEIVEAYGEGVRCLGVQAPNAAAAMFRTAIAQIVQDKGSTAAKAKSTLNAAIIQMVADRTLWDDFGDWAHHVRTTGNAGAHGEAFDAVEPEQASELAVFIREMINFLYVQPARRANAMPVTKKAASSAAGQVSKP